MKKNDLEIVMEDEREDRVTGMFGVVNYSGDTAVEGAKNTSPDDDKEYPLLKNLK